MSRELGVFGLATIVTILLAKIKALAGLFAFVQGTAGLWYPITIGISSLGFRTELVPKALAMVLFVGGTTVFILVKAESFGDRLWRKLD
ncbi:MAG: hypothetical protein ABEI98_01565 [Halorhabdus sp.]